MSGLFQDKDSFVREHPKLLTDMADRVIAEGAEHQKSAGSRNIFETARRVRRRCREIGVSEAFEEYRITLPEPSTEAAGLIDPIRRLLAASSDDEPRE